MMDTYVLIVMLAVGVTQMGCARADNHCDLTAAAACFDTITQSGLMTQFQNTDMSNATAEMLMNTCRSLKTTMDCVEAATKGCSGSESSSMTEGLSSITPVLNTFCNEAMYCMARMNTCFQQTPGLGLQLQTIESNNSMAGFNASWCPSVTTVVTCLDKQLPKQCQLVQAVTEGLRGMKFLKHYCEEQKCSALQQCRRDFELASPVVSGLDSRTCSLYVDFSGCVGQALSSCSSVTSPEKEPAPSDVSQMVGEACSLMAADNVSAIYNCASFTNCINMFMSKQDALSSQNLCITLQGVVGCAVKTVSSCPAVTASAADSFISRANRLTLRAASTGCGDPQISAEKCTELTTCKAGLATLGDSPSFGQQCAAIKIFQSCADSAAASCNLTVTRPPGHKAPSLSKMSTITQKMCTAMDGQDVTTCEEFQECLGSAMMPQSDAELISADSWCGMSVHVLECTRFYSEQCQLPTSLKPEINRIYRQLLDEGCEDKFEYQTSNEPTGGATSLVSVSLSALLLLAVTPRLM